MSRQLLLGIILVGVSIGLSGCGGTYSNPASPPPPLPPSSTNPAPSIAALSPSNTVAGTGGFTLLVNGSGFVSTSVVRWNGTDRPTTLVSSSRLEAAIAASDVATPAMVSVAVFNPVPGGGSSSAPFQVSSPPPAASQGTVQLLVQDEPVENVLQFEVSITEATLINAVGTGVPLLGAPADIDLKSLELRRTVLGLANAPADTYTTLRLTFANPKLSLPTATGQIQQVANNTSPLAVQIASGRTTVDLPISVVVANGAPVGLLVDVSLRRLLPLDASGNIVITNGVIFADPESLGAVVLTPFPLTANQPLGEIKDIAGTVDSVDLSTMSFKFHPLRIPVAVTVFADTLTVFQDFPNNHFSDLVAGQIVEIGAQLRADGTFLATEVELLVGNAQAGALEGLVVYATPNPDGSSTLKLFVRDAFGNGATSNLRFSLVEVQIPASGVKFSIDAGQLGDALSICGTACSFSTAADIIPFDIVDVGLGSQQPLTASQITLKKSVIAGTVSTAPSPGEFMLSLFLQIRGIAGFPNTVTVRTFPVTEFENFGTQPMFAPGQQVVARGLLFRGGGAPLMLASEVRLLR